MTRLQQCAEARLPLTPLFLTSFNEEKERETSKHDRDDVYHSTLQPLRQKKSLKFLKILIEM